MAATAIALHLRAKIRPVSNPRFSHLYSSSSSNFNEEPQAAESQSHPDSSSSSSSSYFSDTKAKLRQQYPQQPFHLSSNGPFSSPATSKVASMEEIRKNLSNFKQRASPQRPQPSSKPDPLSFHELYQRSVIPKDGKSMGEPGKGTTTSFASIRESLKLIDKNRDIGKGTDSMSLSNVKESFKLKPADSVVRGQSNVFGRTNNLPSSVFGKEMKDKRMVESPSMKTEFMKTYTYDQLGEKLKKLRPNTEADNWFSLTELNERLVKLREIEQKESDSMAGGFNFKVLKESIKMVSDAQKNMTLPVPRFDIIGNLNETPSYMRNPPKEQLFEKYFHPDNMSSAETMKLELAKVREEFKMSESDCGSARVQVATLTTKIKHLSNVLHKKDKHSRKGLIEMVERRKKLLKYVRRTDWDSYCLLLSKLGLRDKPTDKRLIKR
ncbi:uncharacterized protein LOC124932940 [Impatiens glandulifera]|uniref:uncharacterized protein LOC124932940 n=1 Tax=Impatiens glandulifera TaxID=253017 RepID=UPI001FB0730F|nr:uncharacterized protein LOC124932940 [Impatiens glandulifera]